eukprot:GFUD01080274.1.p1 GENE.GFUD01080274.1~~GFUD01080274.1.p1  ORF type:complete len:183 (-),score=65.88 GFUD01080274.1:239-787(-)
MSLQVASTNLRFCLTVVRKGSTRKSIHSFAARRKAPESIAQVIKTQTKYKAQLLAAVGVFGFARIAAEEVVAVEEEGEVIKEKEATVEEAAEAEATRIATEKAAADEAARIVAEEAAAAEAARIAAEEAAAAVAARLAAEKSAAAEVAKIAAQDAATRDAWIKCSTAAAIVFVSWVVYLKTS